MIHFHKWQYIGQVKGYRWLLGVVGGIPIETMIESKKCTKCGKIKAV